MRRVAILISALLPCSLAVPQPSWASPATQPSTTGPASRPAATQPTTTSKPGAGPAETIRQFWAAFAGADLDAAGKHYADNVTLKPFCNLMKKEFGVVDKDGVNQDVTVPRQKVIAGYGRMIAALGKDKWMKALGGIAADKIAIRQVDRDGEPFAEARKGDWVLEVAPVKDEGLVFLFRAAPDGRVYVIAEKFDY